MAIHGGPFEGIPQRTMAEETGQPRGEDDTFTFLMDMLLDNWRRTGEIGGRPVPSEEEAIQVASELAMAQMAQLQAGQMEAGQMGGMAPAPTPQTDNPLVAALRGGVR